MAGFEVLSAKMWDCNACHRTTDEATRNAVKKCNGGGQFSIRSNGKEVYRLDRCLGNFYSPSISFWWRAYRQFQNGVLPFPGALLDQPAKALEVFNLFESLEHEKNEIARKNAERKSTNGR